jgi:hypothetical protein
MVSLVALDLVLRVAHVGVMDIALKAGSGEAFNGDRSDAQSGQQFAKS